MMDIERAERTPQERAPHGTFAAYRYERNHGLPVDRACLDARNRFDRAVRSKRRAIRRAIREAETLYLAAQYPGRR
jgi:hypothetical protein